MGHRTSSEPRLTPRQRDVLRGIAAGRTNAEIAAQLGIGFETVKMHVSDILAELGVQSREEAAGWWRDTTSLANRTRRAVGLIVAAKVSVGIAAAAFIAVAGAAALGVVLAWPANTDPAPAEPGVESAGSPAPSPAPTVSPTVEPDIGWEAAAKKLTFTLLDFQADALHTETTIRIEGSMRETGAALVYLVDATGSRHLLGPREAGDTEWLYDGDALPPGPGNVTIEVIPVREYVVPALAESDPTPIWASFPVAFTGYTSTTTEVELPIPASVIAGEQRITVERIQRSDRRARITWSSSGRDPRTVWRTYAFSASTGTRVLTQGRGQPVPGQHDTDLLATPGKILFFLVEDDPFVCDTPTPPPGTPGGCGRLDRGPALTVDNLRNNWPRPVAEFRITLP